MSNWAFSAAFLTFALLLIGLVLTRQRFRHYAKLSEDTLLFILVVLAFLSLGLVAVGLML